MRGTNWIWAVALMLGALPVRASFHTFGVNEVYSNASGTIQYIELHERGGFDGQGFTNGVTITSSGNTYTFPSDLPSQSTANKFVLLATAGYSAIPGVAPADFPIPANFFNPAGDTLNYGFSADVISFGATPGGNQSLNRSGASMTAGAATPTNFTGQTSGVPEPGTTLILGAVATLLATQRRCRR